MDVLGPLILLVLRSLVVLFPMTVCWLAFRRLALSKSGNAWLYAAMCLFSAVTTAGVLPWALGLTPLSWLLLGLALICPVFWIITVVVCDVSRQSRYGPDVIAHVSKRITRNSPKPIEPLVLENPEPPSTPVPVFRHTEKVKERPKDRPAVSTATRTILNLARDIRSNPTSESRRPKLLAPPKSDGLPFVRRRADG
ncbi:MAG: hypothetical protein QNJ20_06525 [Paracoccaceae bacterium]|nr:hypothetical protein [Paracoccaceae bacterium]